MNRIGIWLALTVLVTSFAVLGAGFAGSKHQTFEVRVTNEVMVKEGKIGLSLGCRIYDRLGRQVADLGDGGDDNFRKGLITVLRSPTPVGSEKTLAWELGRLEELDGSSLRKMPEADFTIVKYWVESCEDCQTRDRRTTRVIHSVLDAYKNLSFNFLHVDADVVKRIRNTGNRL